MPTASTSTTVAEIDAQIAELQKQRSALEEAERKAAMAGDAKRATALLAAMRACMKEIEALFPGTFEDEKFAALHTSQAWPRDAKFRRAADLSETEIHSAREIGKKAIEEIR
jgi:hypothetical protein